MLRLVLLLFACDSTSTAPFHRDGSLQFETLDMSGQDLRGASADLSGRPDLGGGGGDLAVSGSCAAALASLSWDFEAGEAGFTHAAIDGYAGDNQWPFDEWQRGTPSGPGPGACHGGSQCWGTYVGGNYISCERAMLTTPSVDLSACAATPVKLVFWHWYQFWTDSSGPWFDGGLVEISGDGGSTWAGAAIAYPGNISINPSGGFLLDCLSPFDFYVDGKGGYVESSGGWQKVEVMLPTVVRTATFKARFAYSTGVSYPTGDIPTSRQNAEPGWYVDDVAIVPQ